MVLYLGIARSTRATGLHIHIGHRAARCAEGDAAAHRARGLREADVGNVFTDGVAVFALILYRHLVVVIDARQRRVVGVHQVVLVARCTVERHPRLVILLCPPSLHDVGLGSGVALLVHVPLQLHRAGVGSLRGIQRVEQRTGADGSLVQQYRSAEHLIADNALNAVVVRLTGVQRLLGVVDGSVHAALPVSVLVGSTVLPSEARLLVCRSDGIDRLRLVIDINLELVAPVGRIAVGGPSEDNAVIQAIVFYVIYWHGARGVHRDRGFAIRPFDVFIHAFGHEIHIVNDIRFVGETFRVFEGQKCSHVGVECMRQHAYFRVVAINDKLSCRRAAFCIPGQLHLAVFLHEYARKFVWYRHPLRIKLHRALKRLRGCDCCLVGKECAAAVGLSVPTAKDIAFAGHGAGRQCTSVLIVLLRHRASAAVRFEIDVQIVVNVP